MASGLAEPGAAGPTADVPVMVMSPTDDSARPAASVRFKVKVDGPEFCGSDAPPPANEAEDMACTTLTAVAAPTPLSAAALSW